MRLPTFRDIKNQARKDLHHQLLVDALYLKSPLDTNPKKITVRVWTRWLEIAKMDGKWTEFEDATPRIIFLRSEIPNPERNAIISVERGEAYRVGTPLAPDGLTITATVALIPEGTPFLSDIPVPTDG